MNKTFLYIVFCWLCAPLFAQTIPESENLVPNGSFEEYEECPLGIADFSVSEWYSATWGTPDYFNVCNGADMGVPSNNFGYKKPKQGSAYVGIGVGFYSPTVCEYIQVKLNQTLTAHSFYKFSCYVSLADSSLVSTTMLGIAFSNDTIGGDIHKINYEPNYVNVDKEIMRNSEGWYEIQFIFEAIGNEKFLTIGFFNDDSELDSNIIRNDIYSGPWAYYYIDNVSVLEFSFEIPNVFTPNNDNANDFFVLTGIPDGFHFIVLNRWGNVVFETNNPNQEFWDGTHKGERCTDGVYFYTLIKEDFKKNGFIHLIR